MTLSAPDVAVVGGGVIGCSVAYHLAQAGASVALLERERVAAGASGGAAGMLAPQVEAEASGAFLDLCLRSRDLYPSFAAALREETGWSVGLDLSGILRVAGDDRSVTELLRRREWQAAAGMRVEWLDPGAARELVPDLGEIGGALWVPDGQISATRLMAALTEAIVRRGVDLRQGVQATGLLAGGGVATSAGPVLAGAVVVCAGPWTGLLDLGPACPVGPVKGQLLRLRTLPRTPAMTVFGDAAYVVPKPDGRAIVGATTEDAGFDRRVTLAALTSLGAAARRLLPALGEAAFEAGWAGLRPATPDGLPVMGRLPGHERVFVASGHLRNGILLAPVTGRALSDLVLGVPTEVDLSPFDPRRFQPEAGDLD